MPIVDDIKRIDNAVSEQREDLQAVSRQIGNVEKDIISLHAATRSANEDRQAMRAEVTRLNTRFDDFNKQFSDHIKSVEAITNQWKGATTAGTMIATGLFRVVGWIGAAALAIWAAWDQIKHAWQALIR
jgi:chromosome segregation ATPase